MEITDVVKVLFSKPSSVPLIANEVTPVVVGIPDIPPVLAFKDNPFGRVPATSKRTLPIAFSTFGFIEKGAC
jgi:hypothetical protein